MSNTQPRGKAHLKRMQKAAWSPAARKKRAATLAAKKAATSNGRDVAAIDLSKLKPIGLLKPKTKTKHGAGPTFTAEQVVALLRGLL
jgi:hypothetical protein